MVTVVFKKQAYRAITKHLNSRCTEQVVFLFLSCQEHGQSRCLTVEDYLLVPPKELVRESGYHAEVSEAIQQRAIKSAWDRKLCLGEIHSHPSNFGAVTFSPSDLDGFREFVPHVWWRLRGKPYVAFVFGEKAFDALAWLSDSDEPVGIDQVIVGGTVMTPTEVAIGAIQQERERYRRQTAFFGVAGQRALRAARVGIVGLGGLGSHVAQQLAYLGVNDFILVDPDKVDRSNLNRLIGGTESDLGRPKVEVAERLIKSIQQAASVQCLERPVASSDARQALTGSSLVFGCLDHDGPRLTLLELCASNRKPYIDVATEIVDGDFGGRVILSKAGCGCLMCRGELDQREIWEYSATKEQLEEDKRIYGVDKASLDGSGPSVVMLNGILASLAVIEFVAEVTGVRDPVACLTYRGRDGVVIKNKDTLPPDCYYCHGLWTGIATVDFQKYAEKLG